MRWLERAKPEKTQTLTLPGLVFFFIRLIQCSNRRTATSVLENSTGMVVMNLNYTTITLSAKQDGQ